MGIEPEKVAPNVVTETKFRQLLANGFAAEIVCQEDAHSRRGNWHGEWYIRAVDQTRSIHHLLVTVPRYGQERDIEARLFKTANGLLSFMVDIGFGHVGVPVVKGEVSSQTLPDARPNADAR